MNQHALQLTLSTALSGLTRVARWMLVLLLVSDLIGSPFHAHHHDGGPDNYSTHTSHAIELAADTVSGLDDLALHVDSDEAPQHGGHSLSGLRGASLQVAHSQAVSELYAVATSLVLAGLFALPVVEVLPGWQPGRERVPIPLFRTVPPNGRAPPSLYV